MAPTTTSPAVVDDSTLKGTNAGVKTPARKKKKSTGYKSQKSKLALQKMQVFFKAHRDEYKDMTFGEQQKALGKLWRESSENPKNMT